MIWKLSSATSIDLSEWRSFIWQASLLHAFGAHLAAERNTGLHSAAQPVVRQPIRALCRKISRFVFLIQSLEHLSPLIRTRFLYRTGISFHSPISLIALSASVSRFVSLCHYPSSSVVPVYLSLILFCSEIRIPLLILITHAHLLFFLPLYIRGHRNNYSGVLLCREGGRRANEHG